MVGRQYFSINFAFRTRNTFALMRMFAPYMGTCVFVCRPARPVTINMGMTMPAWFDIIGLSEGVNEDVEGIRAAAKQGKSILGAQEFF
jgi:hypothetical protein